MDVLLFLQVHFLVPQVVVGVHQDHLLILLFQMAPQFSWRAHPQGIGFDDSSFWNQRTGGDDATCTDVSAVQYDAAKFSYIGRAASSSGLQWCSREG